MPVRDFPILDPDRNLAAWIDRAVSGFTLHWINMGRLYEKTRDPEGLLSTLPAIATTLFGILTALYLRAKRGRVLPLLLAAIISLALGMLWNPWFPINKKLWTSSYVFYAGGWSMLLLAVFYWLFDSLQLQQRSRAARALVWPLLVFGSNAIAAYCFSEMLVESLIAWKLPTSAANGRPLTAWAWLYTHLFAYHGSTENTSLAFGLAYVAVCFVPIWLLWRRRIFLRI
jgi:predicted acyltransferase